MYLGSTASSFVRAPAEHLREIYNFEPNTALNGSNIAGLSILNVHTRTHTSFPSAYWIYRTTSQMRSDYSRQAAEALIHTPRFLIAGVNPSL